jgi:outer membrane protein assembly factor BamB
VDDITSLTTRIHPHEMAGGSGVVYVLGWCGDTHCSLLALGVEPLGVRWMVDLEQIGKHGLMHLVYSPTSGQLFAYKQMSRAIEVFDADTGAHLRTIQAPQQLTDLASSRDGTLVCRSMTGELIRFDAQGQTKELWAKRGLFGRLFGGGATVEGPPQKRMRGLEDGRIGAGLDGELRVISQRWVGRLTRDGELRWSVEVPGANVAIVAPAATRDGTTFAVLRTVGGSMTLEQLAAFTEAIADGVEQSSSVLVRIPPDGGQAVVVRRSGSEEFTALAVTAEGELWLATGEGELIRLSPQGELLWRQAAVE